MRELEVFYLANCPYCRNAQRAVAELREENPAYEDVSLHWIEESEEPEIAEKRDYYRVPTIYLDGEKLYEAHFTHSFAVIKEHFREAFDRALAH